MKNAIKRIAIYISVFTLIFLVGCSGNNEAEKVKELEDKKEGVYLNYIDSAKKYHEGKYKGVNKYDYANVVYEKVTLKKDAENVKDTLPVYECIVTFVVDNSGKKSLRNYLLQVKRQDFCTVVKRWTEDVTNYAKQQVENQKYVEENSRTTKDHDAEFNVGFEGVEVGGKINLGAIIDDTRKNIEATLITLEGIMNDIRNKDITDERLLLNMTEDRYYFAIAYYSKYFSPKIKELSTEDVLKAYDEIKDEDNKKSYNKLLNDYKDAINSKEDIAEDIDLRSKYDIYLEDNNIVKKVKNEVSKNYVDKYYLNNYNVEVPDEFEKNYYSNYSNADYAMVNYENDVNNKKAEVILISNKDVSTYIDHDSLSSDMSTGALQKEINGVLSRLNINEVKYDDKVEQFAIPNSYGYLYTFINDTKYGEVLVFVDEEVKGYTYIVCTESLNGEYEYKNIFRSIRDSIKKTEKAAISKDTNKYVADKMSPTEVESELKAKGFVNITKIPTTEVEQHAALNKIGNLWEGFTRDLSGKHDTEILFKVVVDGDSAYKRGEYNVNVPIEVWYFSDAKFKEYTKEQAIKEEEEIEKIELARSRQERLETAEAREQEENIARQQEQDEDAKTFERQNAKESSGIIVSNDGEVLDVKEGSIGAKAGVKIGDKINDLSTKTNTDYEEIKRFTRYVDSNGEKFSSYEDYLSREDKKFELVGDKIDIFYVSLTRESKLSEEKVICAISFDPGYYDDETSGVIIGEINGNWVVGYAAKDSKGSESGLKVGDVIKEMNGEELLGKAKAEALLELRDKAGKADTLKVIRNENNESTGEMEEKEYTIEIKY